MLLNSKQKVRERVRELLFEVLKPNDAALVHESARIVAKYLAKNTISAKDLKIAELAPPAFRVAKDALLTKIDSWQDDFVKIISDMYEQKIIEEFAPCLDSNTAKYGTHQRVVEFIEESLKYNWSKGKDVCRICVELLQSTQWDSVRKFIASELIHRLYKLLESATRSGTPISDKIARDANLITAILVRPIPVQLGGVKIDLHEMDYSNISQAVPISAGIRLIKEVSMNVVPESIFIKRLITSSGSVAMQNAKFYQPLEALTVLAELVKQGKGPICAKTDFNAPTSASAPPYKIQMTNGIWVSPNDLLPKIRRAAYNTYDRIIVCHLAIACIEGLVRTIAQSQGIKLWRTSGPVGIEDLLKSLVLSSPNITDQINEVFLKECSNLRNSMAHAALAAEDFQDIEETMNVLIDLVALLDMHQLFKKGDFTWMNQFQPDQTDIDFARKLPDDLLSTDSEVLLKQFYNQVHALQHSHSQLIKIGVMNYIKRPGHELDYYWSTIIIAALAESFFRFAAIKLNEPCLTIRPMPSQNAFEMEWQMLDFQRGLLTPSFNTKLESYLSQSDLSTFQTALRLIVKLRNAALHGAWPDLDVVDNYQLVKVFIKFYITLSEILSFTSTD